jgi:hypothetical protein
MIIAAAGCGLFALYVCQSRTAPFNSDGAANVLQAQGMIHGNPLLRGWWSSDVSFYTTELPEYALITAIRGLSPDVVHVSGALTYTLTVLLAALVARGSAAGRASWRRAGVAAGIMLAPSILGGTEVFLENPDHAGTAVPVLLLFLVLDQADGGRARDLVGGRWLAPLTACALLVLAQVGDELSVVAATVPLAAVCAVRLLTGRRFTRAQRRREEALLAAAALSVGLARLADLTIRELGGFDLRPLNSIGLAPLRHAPANASVLWRSLILLFGANNPGTPHQAQTIREHALLVSMADLHVIGLLLAGACLAAGITSLLSCQADRITQLLVAAIIVVSAAGVFTTVLRSLSNAHEVAILLPLAAALAGRVMPEPVRPLSPRLRFASLPGFAFRSRLPGSGAARGCSAGIAALALCGWLAVALAELCYAAAWPATPPPQQALATWLVSQHEREGLVGYWQADATTVTSGGQVLVAPITLPAPAKRAVSSLSRHAVSGSGSARADRWESSAAWYQQSQCDATFVIAVTGPAAVGGLSPTAVRARFGAPAAEHRIGQDVVMLYRYNLLTRLAGTSFPGSS